MAQAMQSQNPAAIIAQTDPRMEKVMTYIKQMGGDPGQAFYALAKQKGVDPNEVLSMVRSLISK